jgi:hypothetical protein
MANVNYLINSVMMTKKEFKEFALKRGYTAVYSGKKRKFFLNRVFKVNIHELINSK